MHAGLAEIRLAGGISRNFGTYAFELTSANILQVLPFGRGRGGFVKIDRDLEAFRDFGSDVARHGDAVFDGDAVNRDKGHDIGCSHARVRTLVFREIAQLGGLPYPPNGGGEYSPGSAVRAWPRRLRKDRPGSGSVSRFRLRRGAPWRCSLRW